MNPRPTTLHTDPAVDIVVPIYNAREDVEQCVASVLRHATGDWRLVLVDDASTDGDLMRFLEQTARSDPHVRLIRNDRNSGFVVSANRGMRDAGGRDVILLNSDTVVTEGFIAALAACAYTDDRTGVVSPFTNNGTICSIPEFCRDNALPADMSIDEYGRCISGISLRHRPELVTAVGFCMYVRAAVFERVDYFDEKHFGRGFGEENDFCERAKAVGFLIRLCDDCFVAHTGKASFGDEGRRLEHRNLEVLARLHPRYLADVAEFCQRNPLHEHHENVKYHLARRSGRRYPAMMFLLHSGVFKDPMGGTEHHVRDLVAHLAAPRALVVFPEENTIVAAEVFDGDVEKPVIHRFPAGCDRPFFERRNRETEAALGRVIDLFHVGAAHLHQLIYWPIGIWRLLRDREIPYFYTIHDYYCVCPSWNLLNNHTGLRCDCAAGQSCDIQECLAAQHATVGMPAPSDALALLAEHRAEFSGLLAGAQAVVAPSQSAAARVHRHYLGLRSPVRAVGHGYALARPGARRVATGRRLRLALLGEVAYPSKGAAAYLELMDQARSLPVEWHVFGNVHVHDYRGQLDRLGLGDALHLHGPYRREEIADLLARHRVDLTVLLPTWHETFSYTLSESWMAGVPAMVSDMGALAERMAQSGAGVIVGESRKAIDVLRRLSTDRSELADWAARARAYRHVTPAQNAAVYRKTYGTAWEIVSTPRKMPDYGEVDRRLFEAHWQTREPHAPPEPQATSLHHQKWWYPHYVRLKPFLPLACRRFARKAYLFARRARLRRTTP